MRAQLPELFYFCLQWFFVGLCLVYTIKPDFYEISPLAKVRQRDVPDSGGAALKSHDASECVSLKQGFLLLLLLLLLPHSFLCTCTSALCLLLP